MSFPYKHWQIIDAGDAVEMSQIVIDYNGVNTITLNRTPWDDSYNTYYNPGAKIPQDTFLALKFTPFQGGLGHPYDGQIVIWGGNTFVFDDDLMDNVYAPMAGPEIALPETSPSMPIFLIAVTFLPEFVQVTGIESSGNAVYWYGASNYGEGLVPADYFNWKTNGKTRAAVASPITLANFTTDGSRIATCDDTTGLTNGMEIGTYQVARVNSGTEIVLNQPASPSGPDTAYASRGDVTDSVSGSLDIGIVSEPYDTSGPSAETFTVTVS